MEGNIKTTNTGADFYEGTFEFVTHEWNNPTGTKITVKGKFKQTR